MDLMTMRSAFAGPGQDTRQWVSIGLVNEETEDTKSTQFRDLGPIITVTLQPTQIAMACRIAGGAAGAGESEYSPYTSKDEVVVLLPNGNESEFGIIIGRLNNGLDAFPGIVAGQDVTKNNFAFRRMRTPYVTETAAAYIIRNAVTNSQFGFDDQGQFLCNDGDKNQFFMGADAVGFISGDKKCTIQIQPAETTVLLVADAASLELNPDASKLITSGTFQVSAGGSLGNEHAVSLEQVVSIMTNFLCLLLNPANPTPYLSPIALLTPPDPASLAVFWTTVLTGTYAPLPAGPLPGGLNLLIDQAIEKVLIIPPLALAGIHGAGKANFLI